MERIGSVANDPEETLEDRTSKVVRRQIAQTCVAPLNIQIRDEAGDEDEAQRSWKAIHTSPLFP